MYMSLSSRIGVLKFIPEHWIMIFSNLDGTSIWDTELHRCIDLDAVHTIVSYGFITYN